MSPIENELQVKAALIDNYNRYAEGLDGKQWSLVRACFADEVLIDYGAISAATGAPDVPRQADDWMLHLKSVINGFDITRHAITNHRFVITENEISCRAYLSADHILFKDAENPVIDDGDSVTVVGEYTNHYQFIDSDWKICQSSLIVHWSSGNMGLFATAPERAAAYRGQVD